MNQIVPLIVVMRIFALFKKEKEDKIIFFHTLLKNVDGCSMIYIRIVKDWDAYISQTTHAGRKWCTSNSWFVLFIQNISQVIRQKIFLEKSWLYFHIDNKYSYA